MQRARYTLEYLLDLLVQRGVLSRVVANDVTARASGQRYKLEQAAGITLGRGISEVSPAEVLASFDLELADDSVLTEDRIMAFMAANEGLRYQKIDPLKLDARLVTSTIPRAFARKHVMLPLFKRGKTLYVASDDPFNLESFESVRQKTGASVEVVLSAKTDILRCVRDIYGFRSTLAAAEQDLTQGVDLGNLEQFFKLKSIDEIESTDKHIVNAVEYLLHYAFDQRASDIHLEPKRSQALIRLRIDGVLHNVNQIPRVVHNAMVSRVKTLGRLDIAEKRRPQDGRIKMARGDLEVELRVSTLPVAFGEKLVCRIFDPMVLLQDIDALGFTPDGLASFEQFLSRPNGLVLVTGPTGSGKTTTLYSALQLLATDQVNVTTIEDPIEMVVEDFNQTSVMTKIGITFASALRTLLRQDPDIIMVGEIRDSETADQAIQAALTGHLVLSTLHTNDSASSITRLLELGVEPFLVASTLTGVVAQRLVRKVCEACRVQGALTREQMLALGIEAPDDGGLPELAVHFGRGCAECRNTGLRGRTGVFEVLPFNTRLQRLVMQGVPATELMKTARQDGMRTLRENAVAKLAAGVTSFEEVLRVTAE